MTPRLGPMTARHSNDKELRQWYREYNEKYFMGLLPFPGNTLEVRFAALSPKLSAEYTLYTDGSHSIHIEKVMHKYPHRAKFLLLHEMCHLECEMHSRSSSPGSVAHRYHATHWNHGSAFQGEMQRLARQGAFEGLW